MATLEAYGKRIIGYLPFSASASGVIYDNTQSGLSATDTQDAIDELASEKVDRAGDEISGQLRVYADDPSPLRVDYVHSGTTTVPAYIRVGNSRSDGTAGSTQGRLLLYSKNNRYAILSADNLTEHRTCQMRDTPGMMALTKDFTSVAEQNGATATEAIPFGKRFYRNGLLYRAIAYIANGASFTSSNCETTNLNVIGTVVTGTSITTTVPTATATNVASVTLSRGVWIICGGGGYSTSFTQSARIELFASSRIYGTRVQSGGINDGHNLNTSCVRAVTASSETIYLQMYQASGSDKTTQYVGLNAVRIA
jgi:hypothetical protein